MGPAGCAEAVQSRQDQHRKKKKAEPFHQFPYAPGPAGKMTLERSLADNTVQSERSALKARTQDPAAP